MKNILVPFIFAVICFMGQAQEAHAFYLDQSIELSTPIPSPYPYVLSQPIDVLPPGYITINVGDQVYYYYEGIFYQMSMRIQKYLAVPAPIGAVVFEIPTGYESMFIDGVTYYEYQGVYYRQVLGGYRVIYPPVQ